jgi:predicted nucleic acid-binding protein
MKSLLVDTNIVIDLLAKRDPFYIDAALLFSMADKKLLKLGVSSLTFANTNYILLKVKTNDEAKAILRKFKLLADVLPLDAKIVDLALNDTDFTDFEDALQYYTAIENNLDTIITRNLKDFKKSKIPVMTAEQYLKMSQ